MSADLEKLFFDAEYKKYTDSIIQKYKGKHVVFYGAGQMFDAFLDAYDINNQIIVAGVCDKKFENSDEPEYKGFKVIKPSCLADFDADVIFVTALIFQSVAFPNEILTSLKSNNYAHIKAIEPLFIADKLLHKGYDIKRLCRKEDKTYYHLNGYDIDIVSDDYVRIIQEVFFLGFYDFEHKFKLKDYFFFDIGMNRAYTALYFALKDKCKKVFGFEPFLKTYEFALENISLNPRLKDKIEPYNFGLGNNNAFSETFYLPQRDGISTTNADFLNCYVPDCKNTILNETVEVKKSSEVIAGILAKNVNSAEHKILKIDAEGAEYEIIPDLFDSGLLARFNIVVGDMHILHSKDDTMKLFDYLYNAGFKKYELNIEEKTMDYIFFKNVELNSNGAVL